MEIHWTHTEQLLYLKNSRGKELWNKIEKEIEACLKCTDSPSPGTDLATLPSFSHQSQWEHPRARKERWMTETRKRQKSSRRCQTFFSTTLADLKVFFNIWSKCWSMIKPLFHDCTFRCAGNVQQALLLYLLNSCKQKIGGCSFGYSSTNAFYIYSTEQLTITNLCMTPAQILST